MAVLDTLFEKVVQLLKYIKLLEERNSTLLKENEELKEKKNSLEFRVEEGREDIEGLSKEKALTKEVIDSLIGNIEALVESGKRNHE